MLFLFRHQHQITIWDDLKHAAKSADGTLHHIGDQIRQRLTVGVCVINLLLLLLLLIILLLLLLIMHYCY